MASAAIVALGTIILCIQFMTKPVSAIQPLNTCSCLGQTISFQCVVTGGTLTLWSGSAFDCPAREISLLHGRFTEAVGSCNDEAIIGRGVTSDGNQYTSHLDVTMSEELVGRTITCSVDDGNLNEIGSITLAINQTNTFPAPTNIAVESIGADEIHFAWSMVPHDGCPSFEYNIRSTNCGTCTPTLTNSNVSTCTNFELSNAIKTCDFCVQNIICSNISGNNSFLQAKLKVPDSPVIRSSIPYYDNRTSILQEIQMNIQTVADFNITPEIDGSAVFYTITYADTNSSAICSSETILASSCEDGICNNLFDVSLSSCPPTTDITITVFATNILGNGQMSSPINLGGENTFVSVTINASTRTIQCLFLRNSTEGDNKECIANVTYGASCDQLVGTFSGNGTSNPITTTLKFIAGITEYCISVNATSNNESVIVEERLNILQIGSSNNDNTYFYVTIAGIVTTIVTVVVSIVTINIIVTVVIVVKIYKSQRQQASRRFEVTPVLKLDVKSKAYFNQRTQNLKDVKGVKSQASKLYSHNNFDQQCYTVEEFHSKYESLAVGEARETETVKLVGRIREKDEKSAPDSITYVIQHINGKKVHIIAEQTKSHRTPDGFKLVHSTVLLGDIVEVNGFPRRNNKEELCLHSTKIELLSPCLHDIQQELAYNSNEESHTRRYLDLIANDGISRKFMIRTKMISFIRKFLDGKGFSEVETPMMNVVAGGAVAKPIKTCYTGIDRDIYLRVAPELYHKMLVVGGFDRVYEIGKQFCDEEIDDAHNPEFTTCEFYMAYSDYKKVMKITEEMLLELVKELKIEENIEYHSDENDPVIIDFKIPFYQIDIITELEKQLGMTIQPSDFTKSNFNKTLVDKCKERSIALPTPPNTPKILRKLIEELIVKKCINPTFILHHPQILCPLAKEHPDREGLTERFELVVRKKKVCNAYTEQNDPLKQRELLEQQLEVRDLIII